MFAIFIAPVDRKSQDTFFFGDQNHQMKKSAVTTLES